MVNERITESEFVLPSLFMYMKGDPKTSELIKLGNYVQFAPNIGNE